MAELRKAVKWMLFLSSYIPLYLILTVKHWDITVTVPQNDLPVMELLSEVTIPIVSLSWVLLAVLSAGFLGLVISIRRSKGGDDWTNVDSLQNRDDLITNYILVYVFPFVVLDYTNLANWIAFVLFFLVIGIIQVRSSHLYVNPVLSLYDYQVYEVDTGDEIRTVISKQDLEGSIDKLKTVELSNGVYLTT